MSIGIDRARKVAKALADAISDVLHERQASLVPRMFIDANVAIRAVLGFRDHATWGEDTEFATTLLTLGQMGTLEVLPPHSLEVSYKIKPYFGDQRDDPKARTAFLQRRGAADISRMLTGESVNGEMAEPRRALNFVMQRGRRAFVALERANGGVQERFRRVPISFVTDDSGLRTIASHSAPVELFETLMRVRPDALDQNRTDAMCWAWLSALAGNIDEPTAGHNVIFFSTDLYFRKAIAEHELPTIRLADEFYILARATLPGLALDRRLTPDGSAPDSSRDGDDILLKLKDVRSVLSDWTTGELPLESLASVVTPWGNVVDVVNGLEELYFIQERWRHWGEMTVNLSGAMSELPQLASSETFRDQIASGLGRSIASRRKELDKSVRSVRRLNQMVVRMRDRLYVKRLGVPHDMYVDPMRDLGLVRWGVFLDDSRRSDVAETIRALVGKDASRSESALTRIAALTESIATLEECLEVVAYLWFFEMYDDLAEVLRAAPARIRHTPATASLRLSLRIMELAARQHCGPPAEDVDALVAELSAFQLELDEGPGTRRGETYLGLGYVAYTAWRNIVDTEAKVYGSPGSPERLARTAYNCGLAASRSIPVGTLAWAFAVNHCAYVGISVGIPHEEVDSWIQRLERIQGQYPNLWNFRFTDTIAYSYLTRAKSLWIAAGRPVGKGARAHVERKDWCWSLAQARQLWDGLKRDLREGEILQHKLEADRLWGLIGCVE